MCFIYDIRIVQIAYKNKDYNEEIIQFYAGFFCTKKVKVFLKNHIKNR